MNRQPSIHITEAKFLELIKEFNWAVNERQVNILIQAARKHQLSGRKLLSTNKKITQKANVIAKSPLEDAMIMAKAIYLNRSRLHHKGIEIAKPASRDFTIIKSITAHAIEFRDEFKFKNTTAAFMAYISFYLDIIGKQGKFNLITLQNKAESIFNHYRGIIELEKDPNKKSTYTAYYWYRENVVKAIGEMLTDYTKIPDKYKYFVQVSAECKRLKVSTNTYINAQFEGLAWTKGIPEPAQLVGDKAMERLQKYLYSHAKEEPKEVGPNKKNIKSLKGLRKLK